MGVYTNGNTYGFPADLFFSMPVKCRNFNYEVVNNLDIDNLARKRINISVEELLCEKQEAFDEDF